MCFDINASLSSQLKRTLRKGTASDVQKIKDELVPLTDLPLYHASGFSHPSLLIYTNEVPDYPTVARWGLVPSWVKNETQQKQIWNKTLNARGETLFNKPAFKEAALTKRCLIYIDGFFEHHHYNHKTYPFFIRRKDHKPMAMAGLWSKWVNPENNQSLNTFTLVTTKANSLLTKIHNNPKLDAPRMPLILPDPLEDQWLMPLHDHLDKLKLQELITSYPDQELEAHTVSKLRGKAYVGNVKEITQKVSYPDLKF